MLDQKLLTLLACPQCHGELVFDKESKPAPEVVGELICRIDALAYPIKDGVPVMLINEARSLTLEEVESYR
jgi:uncharacterized protein YbaR (Trm112 family)